MLLLPFCEIHQKHYHNLPPKKAVKRSATTTNEEVKKSKQPKKKIDHLYNNSVIELFVKPDLRNLDTGAVILSVGQGNVGQLGLGEDVMEKLRPAIIPGYSDIIAIAAGGMHSVCLLKSGKIITFGCNDEGALGRDTSEEGSETVPDLVNLEATIVQITAGDSHSAALSHDGKVYAWGSFRDSHGAMGLTTRGNEREPIEILPSVKIVKIASGADHLIMLSEDGVIYTCGCGEQGQLGRVAPRSADRHNRHGMDHLLKPGVVEFRITKKLHFNNIWAGQYCTFARESSKGDIYVCGLNNFNQIGLQNTEVTYHIRISRTFSDRQWQHISSGQHHSLALDSSGDVYVIGRKEYGRLGLGPDCADAKTLIRVDNLKDEKIVDIAAGTAQSFAVTESGKLFAWGMGDGGPLGTGTENDVDTPVAIKCKQLEDRTVVRVAGGGQHTLILALNPAKTENTD